MTLELPEQKREKPASVRKTLVVEDDRVACIALTKILESLGAAVKFEADTVTIHAAKIKAVGDYEMIRKMRGSICILGPLVARLKRASVSLPGGCVIGARPIDLHLKGLEQMGARFSLDGGYIDNLTVAHMKRLGADVIFAVDVRIGVMD